MLLFWHHCVCAFDCLFRCFRSVSLCKKSCVLCCMCALKYVLWQSQAKAISSAKHFVSFSFWIYIHCAGNRWFDIFHGIQRMYGTDSFIHIWKIIIGRYAFAYWKHFSLSVCYMCTSYVVNVIVFDSQLNFFPKPIDNRHMQSCVVLFLGDFCVVPFRVFLWCVNWWFVAVHKLSLWWDWNCFMFFFFFYLFVSTFAWLCC